MTKFLFLIFVVACNSSESPNDVCKRIQVGDSFSTKDIGPRILKQNTFRVGIMSTLGYLEWIHGKPKDSSKDIRPKEYLRQIDETGMKAKLLITDSKVFIKRRCTVEIENNKVISLRN